VLGSLSVFSAFLLIAISFNYVGAPIFLFLPLLFGLIATFMGATALKRIKEQPDVYKGKGMVIPGFIMGLVITGIYLLIFLLAILFA
jgi:uncharacterized membrane protein (DUF485 family)